MGGCLYSGKHRGLKNDYSILRRTWKYNKSYLAFSSVTLLHNRRTTRMILFVNIGQGNISFPRCIVVDLHGIAAPFMRDS